MTYQEMIEILMYTRFDKKTSYNNLIPLIEFTNRAKELRVYRIPANEYIGEITSKKIGLNEFSGGCLCLLGTEYYHPSLKSLISQGMFDFESRDTFLSWCKLVMRDFLEMKVREIEKRKSLFEEMNLGSYEFKLILEFYLRKHYNIETEDLIITLDYIPSCIKDFSKIIIKEFDSTFKDFKFNKFNDLLKKMVLERINILICYILR